MALSIIERPSLNFDSRGQNYVIDMILLHYTGMLSAKEALDRMRNPLSKVSAHYMIDDDGTIIKLVDENDRAWHAGISSWRGNTNINSRSIGIELTNPGHEHGYQNFTVPQMESLVGLGKEILARYPIPNKNVVGHSDVAPLRKMDPGELFDWEYLAGKGIGLWPKHEDIFELNDSVLVKSLQVIGYDISNLEYTVKAFQRHFRQKKITGKIDSETAQKIVSVEKLQ